MNHPEQTISEEEIREACYSSPMLVPSIEGETAEMNAARWVAWEKMSQKARDICKHDETQKTIRYVKERYHLTLEQMASISRAVRAYYAEQLPVPQMATYIAQDAHVERSIAAAITDMIVRLIIAKPLPETQIMLPLTQAMDRYPHIRDQIISDGAIEIGKTGVRMRGTIENWITDYHLAIGQGQHEAVDRGNYIFHNQNAAKLIPADRQNLAIILKSLDEGVPLTIDIQNNMVLFPEPPVQQRQGEGVVHEATQSPKKIDVPQEQRVFADVRRQNVVPSNHNVPQEHVDTKIRDVSAQRIQQQTANVPQQGIGQFREDPTGHDTPQLPQSLQSQSATQPMGYVRFSSGHRFPAERTDGDVQQADEGSDTEKTFSSPQRPRWF